MSEHLCAVNCVYTSVYLFHTGATYVGTNSWSTRANFYSRVALAPRSAGVKITGGNANWPTYHCSLIKLGDAERLFLFILLLESFLNSKTVYSNITTVFIDHFKGLWCIVHIAYEKQLRSNCLIWSQSNETL